MDSIYQHDVLSSVDMDDLGVRPWDWIDINKNLDDPIKEFFGQEKTVDFTVYAAELQSINNGKKLTTNDDETSMSDDDDNSNDYDIDPETGEKVFREVTLVSQISLSSPTDKWIEEYLSNIESTSDETLPTTTNNSAFIFENLSFPNEPTDTDWLSSLINLDETTDSIMFTDSNIVSEYLSDDENKSNQITTSNGSNNESVLNVSIDDEYSTSSNSDTSRQHRLYSSLENDSEITFIEAKLEKIDRDENPISRMMARRTSTRSNNQGQQDEETLQQFNIPLTLNDITQSSTEEYNHHLTRLSHLSSEQIHIIKDIRRRGKNKIAAQNCRKRKAISVESLLEEVDELKRVKHELEERKRVYQQQIAETRNQYEYLHRQVLPDRQLPPAIIVK
jgi:hypothetical protein